MHSRFYNESYRLHFKSNKTLAMRDGEGKIEGNFLFCWPYDRNLELPPDNFLIPEAEKAVTEWKAQYIPGENAKSMQIWIHQGTAMACILHGGLLKANNGFQKLVCYSEWMWLNLLLDDYLETHCKEEHFSDLNFHTMRMIAHIGKGRFFCVAELKENLSYQHVLNQEPGLAEYLHLLYHWFDDFYRDFNHTPESTQYLRSEWDICFGIMSWCGSSGFSHLRNPSIRDQFRVRNSGGLLSLEVIYALWGFKLGPEIRGSMHWMQANIRGVWLTCFINDLFSFEKEWKAFVETGQAVDNHMFLSIKREDNVTLTGAVEMLVQEHDETLREFKRILQFVKQNPRYAPEDKENRREFFESLDVCAQFVANNIHFHRMKRYSQFELELKEIVE